MLSRLLLDPLPEYQPNAEGVLRSEGQLSAMARITELTLSKTH